MPEYGREYWERHQVERRLTPKQLLDIADGHLQRENALLWDANRFLFTDTNALTTYVFALQYHGDTLQQLRELADGTASRYDLVFLCEDDIPYDDTEDRSGPQDRAIMQRRTMDELLLRRIPFVRLRGDLSTRLSTAARILRRFEKWKPLLEHELSPAGTTE